jgi:hypothetical protein
MTSASSKPFRLRHLPPVREAPLAEQICRLLSIELARPGHPSPHGVLWYAVDAANSASAVPGTRIARGIIAGIPDLAIIHAGRCYWIELKAEDGRLSAAQTELHAALQEVGCPVAVCRSAEGVLFVLDEWRIPRHRRAIL